MTREIRFRAWDTKSKEMVGVRTIDWDAGHVEEVDTETYCWSNRFDPPSLSGVVLMQFTGLKDKNGKEIWEGDILEQKLQTAYGSWITMRGVMEWMLNDARFGIAMEIDENVMGGHGGAAELPIVIGNVYEHPELLTSHTLSAV